MYRRTLKKWLTFGVAVVIVVLVIIGGVKLSGEIGDFTQERQKNVSEGEQNREREGYSLKLVPFVVYDKLSEDTFFVVENNLAGVVDSQGEYLVEPLFTYMNYFDGEWITFEDGYNMGYVYDTKGNQLFTYNSKDIWVSEEGIGYNVWVSYQKGIKTELLTGAGSNRNYGVRYYNAQTEELLYEAVNSKVNLAASAFPDENGVAVAVENGETATTVYRITKDGYETQTFEKNAEVLWQMYYTAYLNRSQNMMSDGWLKCSIWEQKKTDLVGASREALFNIYTGETVFLPENYQDTYAAYYKDSKGLYYGISTLTEKEYYGTYPEVMHYAICHGDKVLSEEIYTWITFGEKYILAGNETFARVLDYEGTVLKELVDISSDFVDGKLVVYSGAGVYFMDEELNIELEAVMKDSYYLGPGFVWDGIQGYMILEKQD